jgi:hypothetical protein
MSHSEQWLSVCLAGNFQVPYGSSRIHSVFVFASPGRQWLLQHKQQTADVHRDTTIQGFKSGIGAGGSVCPLRAIHRFKNRLLKNSGTARRKCVDHQHVWTTNDSQSADPYLATAVEGRYIGNRGKQPQSDVVGESSVPEVWVLHCLNGNWSWTLWGSSFFRRLSRKPCFRKPVFLTYFRFALSRLCRTVFRPP